MRLAQIIDGVVANIAEVDPENVPEFMVDWIEAGQTAIGWKLEGGTFVPPIAAAPVPDVPQDGALLPAQWSFFLDLTGFRSIVEGVLDAMPKTTLEERAVWAALKADVFASRSYRKEVFLELVNRVRAMGVQGIPTDAEIEAAWPLAVAYEGAQKLISGQDA